MYYSLKMTRYSLSHKVTKARLAQWKLEPDCSNSFTSRFLVRILKLWTLASEDNDNLLHPPQGSQEMVQVPSPNSWHSSTSVICSCLKRGHTAHLPTAALLLTSSICQSPQSRWDQSGG
jgi:hypothetical protein